MFDLFNNGNLSLIDGKKLFKEISMLNIVCIPTFIKNLFTSFEMLLTKGIQMI